MSTQREITTLGRGGSDTTAVALAAALGAARCEIYSDVDGVYSADPRVVPEAVHLPELDLASLQEMAEAGAKVLSAQAVEWARRAGIAIHARRTSDPLGGGRETVCAEGATRKNVRAVVGLDRVVHGRVAAGELRAFAELASQLDLGLLDVAAAGDVATCAIPLINVPDWDRCRASIEERLGSAASLVAGCAVVSVVGNGLASGLARFVGVLDACGAAATAIHAGPLRLAATIAGSRLADAQRAMHAEFVEAAL
jgi:aspartate kinase